MYAVRAWSVRHARGLNAFYRGFEGLLVRLHRLFSALGYERIERPTAAVEKAVKGLLFDCRMVLFVTTSTDCSGATASAARRPARPPPMITTSANRCGTRLGWKGTR